MFDFYSGLLRFTRKDEKKEIFSLSLMKMSKKILLCRWNETILKTVFASDSEAIQNIVYNRNMRQGCVYIITNERNGTLYTGVTSNLKKRIHEHKNNVVDGFTKKYKLHKLVYYECGESIFNAIEEEKRIKAGSRKNKLKLIEDFNPNWEDLSNNL